MAKDKDKEKKYPFKKELDAEEEYNSDEYAESDKEEVEDDDN